MKSHKKRLEKIERKGRFDKDGSVIFYDRIGHEWTEQEKQWIRSRHPTCRVFIKPLSKTMPYGYERQGKEAVALYKDLCRLVDWEADERRYEKQGKIFRERYGGRED